MSKDNTAGGGGKTDTDGQDEEEFIIVETDESGKPINQGEAAGHDSEDDDDIDDLERDDDQDDDHDDDEQRMGHAEGEQEEETPEERRDRRKREQRAKRVRNRVTAEAKDRLIQNQGRMLLNLQEQVAKLQGRSVQYDVNLLQSQLAQVESQQTDAKAVLAKLVKAGDGEGVAEITELQMQLRDQHRQIAEQLKRAKSQKKGKADADDGGEADDEGQQTQQPRKGPAPDPEVVRRAQAWAAKHRWADRRKGDPEEVQIVRAIDHNLHQEGWDPRSQDYWDELTSRVRRRLPNHFKKAAPNGEANGGRRVSDNGGKRPAAGGPRMAPASQSGGGSRPLGKNEVRVTPDRKKAMQEAGMWDDPKKRNRMLAQYAKYDRENAA